MENISDFLVSWGISENPADFTLQWDGQEANFVTEKNRLEIKDGTMLLLTNSPSKKMKDLFEKLKSDDEAMLTQRQTLFEQLSILCSHQAFSSEFISQDGIKYLITCIGMLKKSINAVQTLKMISAFLRELKQSRRMASICIGDIN